MGYLQEQGQLVCGYPTKKLSLSIHQPTMDSLHTLRERRCLLSPTPLHDRPLMGPIPCRCHTGNHKCQRFKRSLAMSLPEDNVPQHQCYFHCTPSPSRKKKQRYLDTINDAVNLVRLKPLLISTFSKPVSS